MKGILKLIVAFVFCLTTGLALGNPVNVNTASASEIAEALSGVGKSKAEAIVKDRESNGPYKSADDLARVKGIGRATIEKNKDSIVIN